MRKIVLPLASVALVVLLSLGISGSMPTGAQALTAKPNIVFILADDMRKDDLKYMPQTRSLLADKGLDAAGYRTGLLGKYFNGYNQGNTYIPPGWGRWFAASATVPS